MDTIKCSRCGDDKPLSAFPKNVRKKRGVDLECLRCKRLREGSPAARRAKRIRYIRAEYGMSAEQYDALVVVHDNRCGICRRPERKRNGYGEVLPLAIDHDHNTNVIRGLLCSSCNKGIGLLGDSVESLERALGYLRGAA